SLLQGITGADMTNDAFPYQTSREIDVAGTLLRASRISYVGELGWELYIPSNAAVAVLDAILAAGEGQGLALAGMHAMQSLRIEKAYRAWGHDIGDQDSGLEAGLGFAIAWNKPGGFIGREALLRQREKGVTKRLVQFALNDPEPLLYGREPIYRDGDIAGYVTSAMYGHTLGAAVGLGYVSNEGLVFDADFIATGAFEIEIAGVRHSAAASLKPLFDPTGERARN
ncbi:MAG: aminomethyltransferase family protein, partial [Rhodospirillales bacterium]